MKKSIINLAVIAASLLILSLSAFSQQQSKLEISYDKFDDTTTIFGRRVSLIDDITNVSIQPSVSYKGQKPSEKDERKFYLVFSYVALSSSPKERQRFQNADLIILTDSNERIAGKSTFWKETHAEVIGNTGVDVGGFSNYLYFIRVDVEQLKKLASAKSAEVRWYGRPKDYTLNQTAISAIKEIADYFSLN